MKVPATAFRCAALCRVVPECRRRAAANADAETRLLALLLACLLTLAVLAQ